MSTNTSENRSYTGRLTYTTQVNGSSHDVYLNGTKVVSLTMTPLRAACLHARQQNYGSHVMIDLITPLVGGGTRMASAPIYDGLSASGPTYG